MTRYVDDLVNELKQEVRRSVADELAAMVRTDGVPRARVRALPGRQARRPRSMMCIAPNCQNESKGPRFHYLCEKHMDAPKRDYEAWRLARKEARREEGRDGPVRGKRSTKKEKAVA